MIVGRATALVAAFVWGSAAIAALPAPGPGLAVATGSLTVDGTTQSLNNFGSLSSVGSTATLSATLTNQPSIYAYSTGPAGASAEIFYDYAVFVPLGVGATPDLIHALITATGNYSLTITGGYAAVQANSYANGGIDGDVGGYFRESRYFGMNAGQFSITGPGAFAGTVDTDGVTDAVFTGTIHLAAGFTNLGTTTAQAFIDPIITINLGALHDAGFTGTPTLVLSPGAGNGTVTIPEPAAWAMFVAGFGLVGGAIRRRGVQATA